MKQFILFLLILTALSCYFVVFAQSSFAGKVSAENKNYVSLFGNLADMIDKSESSPGSYIDKEVKNNTGWGGSIELGRKLNGNFRMGLQYGFNQMKIRNKIKTYKPSVTNGNIGNGDPYKSYANHRGGMFKEKGLYYDGSVNKDTDKGLMEGNMVGRIVDNGNGTYTNIAIFTGSYTKDGKTSEVTNEVVFRHTWRVDGKKENGPSSFSTEDTLKVQTIMANAYWDWHFGRWSPYIGTGIGVAHINKGKRFNLAWQAKAGLGYFLTRSWKVSAGVTYLDVGDVQFEEGLFNIKGSLQTVQANFGLTYLF